jgi:hypothetical protein
MRIHHKRKNQTKLLRNFRRIHRITASYLFVSFLLIAITGLLLGWKKNSQGLIQAKTIPGTSTNLSEWLPMDSLQTQAFYFLHEKVSNDISLQVARIDLRQDKGVAKFIFEQHYWAVHLDGATGQLLQIEQRRSDFIEDLHDGSIVDHYLNIEKGIFKLFYMTITGLALLIFTVTGFLLWYGPIWARRKQKT